LTIRSILKEIEHSGNFKVKIIEDISLDEHLRRISKKETLKIAYRLLLTTIIAIPTFVFGIVGMSFLPKGSSLKMWLDEPLWTGNTSRMTWILFFLATPVYFFAADIFHVKALKEIRTLWTRNVSWKRRLFRFGSMNLLMCLGTSISYFSSIVLLILAAHTERAGRHSEGAFTSNYFDSVVFLTFFLLIGRLLESYSKTKTAETISSLGNLKPSVANLIDEDGDDYKTDLKMLEVGDLIRIVPGESPAVDCIIQQGTTKFDESALTGESVAIEHTVGEQIFAGTVNKGPSSIIAKISTLDGTSLIDQIVSTVRDGQMKRAPIERTADVLTGVFVPIITFIAILTWVIWISLGYSGSLPEHYLTNDIGGWAVWSLEFAIAVFVIACPCGIGLAAPTALFVGAGLAAKNGILARGGGIAFQEGSKVNIICFDKTGTLTMGGDLRITNFATVKDSQLLKIVLQITKDLEMNSSHPLAVAVKNFVEHISLKKNIKLGKVKVHESEEIPGKGLKGDVIIDEDDAEDPIWKELKPESVLLGNETLMRENNVNFSSEQSKLLNDWKLQGKSIIIVSLKCSRKFNNDKYHAVLIMASRDELRPEAKDVINYLKTQNIKTFMISGDNYLTANAIAKELGIDNVIAEVLPEEKAQKIKWIKSTHYKSTVAMVGDGVNDAPALAMADVGVALASGSDLALTSSDFVLLSPNFPLVTLLTLLQLSRKVFRRVRFNFGWALIYNMIGVPIAAGVIYPYNNSRLSPVWASAAMALSSISVVLSSLALKFFRRPKVVLEETKKLKDFEAVEELF
jgi:heavy metal translocating P-type ATPase